MSGEAVAQEGTMRSSDPPAPPSDGYIPGLDGIRAVCVSTVMVAHYGFGHIVPGGLGVTIFFFLSGFLITNLLLREQDATRSISLANFYVRRFLRLMPELLLLILFGIVVGVMTTPIPVLDVLAALFYVSNYYQLWTSAYLHAGVNWPHLWSLAVEEHFYLTFPLALILLRGHLRLLLTVLVAFIVVVLAWRLAIVAYGAPFGFQQVGTAHPYTYIASDTRMDSIVYGCLTTVCFRLWRYHARGAAAAMLLLSASAALLMLSLALRSPEFRESWRYSLQGLAVMLFFCALFRSDARTLLVRVLEAPLLRRMGVLSYGAYLWHLEAIRTFGAIAGEGFVATSASHRLLLVAFGFVFSFAAAFLSFKATMPLRRLRTRFHAAALHT